MDWRKYLAVGLAYVASATVIASDGPGNSASAPGAHASVVQESRGGFDAPTPEQAAVLRAIREADARQDRLDRCLHYPDPPRMHWSGPSVAVLCHMQFDSQPTLAELRAKLDNEGPQALDSYFDGLRKAQAVTDTAWKLDLITGNTLGCACQAGRELADAWLAREPGSKWASLASGMQFAAAAHAARGSAFAQETSPAQFAGMHMLDERARAPLKRALALDPGLTPAINALLWIDADEGSNDILPRLDAALRAHPGNFMLHTTAGQLLQPKWFGTAEAVEGEIDRARAGSSKFPALLMVVSDLEIDRRSCGKDCRWKRADVDAVNAIGPYVSMFRKLVDIDLQTGDYAEAAIYASEILRFSRQPEWGARTQRGVARRMLNDLDGASADAEYALMQRPSYRPALELAQAVSLSRGAAIKAAAQQGK